MNPAIADLLINSSLFILLGTLSLVNLLKSTVVIYLLSMSDIFASWSVFFTKLLTLGILFSTSVNVTVAKPEILGIWLSISVFSAL